MQSRDPRCNHTPIATPDVQRALYTPSAFRCIGTMHGQSSRRPRDESDEAACAAAFAAAAAGKAVVLFSLGSVVTGAFFGVELGRIARDRTRSHEIARDRMRSQEITRDHTSFTLRIAPSHVADNDDGTEVGGQTLSMI